VPTATLVCGKRFGVTVRTTAETTQTSKTVMNTMVGVAHNGCGFWRNTGSVYLIDILDFFGKESIKIFAIALVYEFQYFFSQVYIFISRVSAKLLNFASTIAIRNTVPSLIIFTNRNCY